MSQNRSKRIIENPVLLRKIVYAVNKAISQDVPQNKRENRLETNNRNIFATGDLINDNLRYHVVTPNVDLIPFTRSLWEGRIVADRVNKVTYTICTRQNLKRISAEHRNQLRVLPHYLATLLGIENGDCEGHSRQMTLTDINPDLGMDIFGAEVLEEDFDRIMQGSISKDDEYKHYVLAYTAKHYSIVEIELLLLDKDFVEVDKLDLMEYVTPDFMSDNHFEETENEDEVERKKSPLLLKLKENVKARKEEA